MKARLEVTCLEHMLLQGECQLQKSSIISQIKLQRDPTARSHSQICFISNLNMFITME